MSAAANETPRVAIVAGMPRAATTFLYHTLAKHPGVWVPPRKEVEYFSLNLHRGPEWYRSFFEGASPSQIGFDVSPIYFMVPEVPERIRAHDPGGKVVLLIRDPVEFVLSFYQNRKGAGHEELAFPDFLDGHEYVKDGQTVQFVFDDGRIEETIERFREVFGDDLLLCSYAEIRSDPLGVLQAIEGFVGLEPHFDAENFENVVVNASDQKNIVWLNRLMHQKWFADLVVRLVPKRLILKVRYWVQTRRTGDSAGGEGPGQTDPDRELAERRLAGDQRYVQQLFERGGVLLGSGRPVTSRGAQIGRT